MIGHNPRQTGRPSLTLSEERPRLNAAWITRRHLQLVAAPRTRVHPELVAAAIRADGGDVWGAVVRFGISYGHALRIRRGWRGGARWAEAIPYRSRGYYGTERGSARPGSTFRVIDGGRAS